MADTLAHAAAGMLTSRRRPLALASLCTLLFLTFLDNTVVSVALANIQSDLHGGVSALQWVVGAYALTFASLMLPCGMMGDKFGRKKIMLTGAGVYCVGAALAAVRLQPGLYLLAGVAEAAQVHPVRPLPGQAAVPEREAEQPQELLVGQVRVFRDRGVVGQAFQHHDDVIAFQVFQCYPFSRPGLLRPAAPAFTGQVPSGPECQERMVAGCRYLPVPGAQPVNGLTPGLAAADDPADDGLALIPGPDQVAGPCVANLLRAVDGLHDFSIRQATVPA